MANASFMVDPACAGRGIGRALAEVVLERARAAGYRAMQFNAVVATNVRAVALWRSLGFTVVGGVSLLAASVPLRRRVASLGAFALAVLLPIVVYGGLAARVLGLKLPA